MIGPAADEQHTAFGLIGVAFALVMSAATVILLVLAFSARAPEAEATSFLPEENYMCFDFFGPVAGVSAFSVDTKFDQDHLYRPIEGTLLCASARKNGLGNLAEPPLRCHRPEILNTGGGTPTAVPPQLFDVVTQFGVETDLSLFVSPTGPYDALCVPASVGVATLPTAPYYYCYAIFPSPDPQGVDVSVETAYGTQTVTVGRARTICASAIMDNAKGSLDEPTLVCYDVTSPPFTQPQLTVYTQFISPQAPTTLGLPELLCVGATQDVSVGGIAEIDSVARERLDAAGGSSGAPTAIIAMLAAAAALLLGAAGLAYTRRSSR